MVQGGDGGPFEDRRGDFQGLLGAHLVYLKRQTPSNAQFSENKKKDEKLLLTLEQCKVIPYLESLWTLRKLDSLLPLEKVLNIN